MTSKNNFKAWIYLAPSLILLIVFALYPLIDTFIISFLKDYNYINGKNNGLTLDNYKVLFQIIPPPSHIPGLSAPISAFFTSALPNTLLITFVTVPVSIILALIISAFINSIKACQRFFQTLFFTPYVTNIIAVGMVFGVIFSHTGIINSVFNLNEFFIEDNPDTTYFNAMLVIFLDIIWYQLPFKILIFVSGLQGIDKTYYDAARVDSAGKLKQFFKITVPLLSPQILYISITSFINGFKEYQTIAGLFNRPGTKGNSYNLYTVVYFVYDQVSSGNGNTIRYACAGAVVLFLIILAFTGIQFLVSKKKVHY